jgi:transcription initiation factor TFIIB
MFSGRLTKKTRRKSHKDLWNSFEKMKQDKDKEVDVECIYSADKSERTKCDNCHNPVQVTELGFLACTNSKCGMLFTDTLDQTAEWRFYGSGDSNSQDPTRCGMPVSDLLEKSSYGCKVFTNSRSSYQMKKISRYTEWQSMPHSEKTRYDDFEHIKTMANNAGIPKIIIDDALRYHKKISGQKTFRALNRDGIIAASIYIAARINNCPRTAKEIATIFHLENTAATRGCKNATTIINKMENNEFEADKTNLCKIRPVAFIERYCSKLKMNKELTRVCQFVAMKIEHQRLIPENVPDSIAAGVVYFVSQTCNLNLCKNDIYVVTDVSPVTITKCFKKLEKFGEQLLPKMIQEKYATKRT